MLTTKSHIINFKKLVGLKCLVDLKCCHLVGLKSFRSSLGFKISQGARKSHSSKENNFFLRGLRLRNTGKIKHCKSSLKSIKFWQNINSNFIWLNMLRHCIISGKQHQLDSLDKGMGHDYHQHSAIHQLQWLLVWRRTQAACLAKDSSRLSSSVLNCLPWARDHDWIVHWPERNSIKV